MGNRTGIVALATLVGCLLLPVRGFAQSRPAAGAGDSRVTVFVKGGFGGELDGEIREVDDEGEEPSEPNELDDADMEMTQGLGAEFAHAVQENVLVGGRLSLNWVNTDPLDDDDIDRSMLLNVDIVPRGRLPLSGVPIDLYLAVPVGLTVNFPNDDLDADFFLGETEFGTGVSWNLSVLGGATYWFGSSVGIFAETGWYHQRVVFPLETTSNFTDETVEEIYSGVFNQFAALIGIQFGL